MSKIGKSKYIAFIVLLVIALASVVIALTGCNSGGSNSSGSSDTGSSTYTSDTGNTEAGNTGDDNTGTVCTHEHTVTTSTATCTEAGVETVTCSDCNTVISTKDVAALGHDYESVVTSSTCTAQGYTTYTCSRCDESYVADYTEAGAHNYEAVVTEPTCTAQGYTTYTCSECHDSYVADYVAAADHTWTGNSCEGQECSVCGATIPATTTHNYVTTDAASCTQSVTATYTCTICGDHYDQVLPATGHTYTTDVNGEVVWYDGSTTLKTGTTCTYVTTYYTYCETCGEKIETSNEVDIHTYVLTVTDPATCTTAGTKEMKCSVCEAILENSAVSYYAEHVYGDTGTSNADGSTTYTCTNTGCTNTKTVFTSTSAAVSTDTLANDVEFEGGTVISMSSDAVSGLDSSSNLTLSADSTSASNISGLELTDEELERVGDSTVYNITLTGDSGNITNFNGTITVKLPYSLADGEDETNITIFYISGTELVTITNAVYSDGYVTFETDHFSYYTVGRYTAAELCAKYGHNYNVITKNATCTEDGYTLTACTRCGESTYVKIEATGHTYTTTTEATCTTNGLQTCSVCGHTEVIVALGHTWVATEDCVEATCEHAGYNTYKCSVCGTTYVQDIAQLSHNYTAVVTAATCTEAGYTTYTCSSCGGSYVADYVAATGHTWNSDAACADRECIVCGTILPATAEHTYANGSSVCTVCGGGCNHSYTSVVTAPTCTEAGYTTYTCSNCGNSYKGDYVAATGHSYTKDITKCDGCGIANPDLVTIFNTIIENCYSYNYTLTLSDVTFTVTQEYVEDDEISVIAYNLDSATLYISYQDGKVIIYGKGSVDYAYTYTYIYEDEDPEIEVEEYTGSATIYGDGEYIYMLAESDGEENIQRISYEYALGDYYDMIFNSGEYMAEYEDMINAYLENELVQSWIAILQSNTDMANELAADMFYSLFSGKAVEGGYEFTLNIELLAELNENLKTLTVAELVDEYAGEGAYDALSSYIAGLENKTLYEVVTEILEYSENFGVDSELVFTTIDTVVTLYTGEEFSIESLLVDDSEESTVIGEMTIAEILAEFVGLEDYSYITDMLEEYGAVNIYDMLAEMMGEEYITLIYNTIGDLASSEVIAITFITDSTYAVTAIKLVLTDASYSQTIYESSYDVETETSEATVYSTFVAEINGTLNVTYTCELPADYTAAKTEVEELYSAVISAIKTACAGDGFSPSSGTFAVADDGTLAYVNKYSGATMLDVSAAEDVSISLECETCGIYNIYITDGNGAYAYFYYNAKTNALSTSYETKTAVELLAGSTTCEDGILVKTLCAECGSVLYSYTTDWHYRVETERYTLTSTAHDGASYVIKYECACGASSYYTFDTWTDDGCYFNEGTGTYDEETGAWTYVYNCAIEGCSNYYTRVETSTQSGCYIYYTYTYTYYGNDGTTKLVTYTTNSTSTAHTYDYDNSYTYYTDEEGNIVSTKSYEYSYTCSVCGYSYGRRYTYDELGRTTSNLYYEKNGSEYSYYSYYVYEYVSNYSCECTVYYYDTYGGEAVNVYTSTNHLYSYTEYYADATCTQPVVRIYSCKICGENTFVDYWYIIGHDFEYDEELDCYVCTQCGLQSTQGSSGTVIIEDLTESETYGQYGYITIGYYYDYDWYYEELDSLSVMFTFVPVDSQGETDPEGEILAEIDDYATYNYLEFSDIYLEDYGNLSDTILQVSLDDIVAAAESEGLDLSDYDLRIAFVPLYGDGLVCSITITDLATLVAE